MARPFMHLGKLIVFVSLLTLPIILHNALNVHRPEMAGAVVGLAGAVHTAIYTGLLIGFGLTLLPGREPVITFLARLERGTLNHELEIYTRRVTILWCGFFLGELLASLILFNVAPRGVWILFVSALNLPLVAIVFVGEYLYRRIRLRHYTHESLLEMIRLSRKVRMATFKRPHK